MAEPGQPIIIKRIKKGGHGHHGGAWKVAFADFVTAMMAFFLLLWLLGSTTEEQKRGISDYFENPAGYEGTSGTSNAAIDMGGGMDAPQSSGDTPDTIRMSEGTDTNVGDGSTTHVSAGGKQTLESLDADSIEEEAKAIEAQRLTDLKEKIEQAIEASLELKEFREQLLLDITSEGLRIQIVDKENRPMFDSGSAKLKDYTQKILREIVKVVSEVPNKVSLTGHTDQTPFNSRDGYSNWELSADRANAARRELVAAGMTEEKIGRVVGLSSSVLFDKENPFNPINRRISLIVMNKATEEELQHAAGPATAEGDGSEADEGVIDPIGDVIGVTKPVDTAEPEPAPATAPPLATNP